MPHSSYTDILQHVMHPRHLGQSPAAEVLSRSDTIKNNKPRLSVQATLVESVCGAEGSGQAAALRTHLPCQSDGASNLLKMVRPGLCRHIGAISDASCSSLQEHKKQMARTRSLVLPSSALANSPDACSLGRSKQASAAHPQMSLKCQG